MVIAAMIMILFGALTIEEAYESVDWRTVFLVAGMLSLGMAMELTGTANYIADLMLDIFGPYGPLATLAGIYLLAAIITVLRPDPQTLFKAVAPTLAGRPAKIAAWRAGA